MSVESVSSRCLALAADVEDVLLRLPGGEDAATLDRVASELARLGNEARLDELRVELRAERLSYGELAELQGLVAFIDPGDVELLEAAGVPEFPTSDGV